MPTSLFQIPFNDDLNSYKPRANFQTIEDKLNDQDTRISAIVAPSTKVQINTCESLTGWATGGDASLSLNSTTYREGTKSIQFDKTGATVQLFETSLTIPATVFDNRKITIWVYIDDNTTRDNLNAAPSSIDIGAGSDFKRISFGSAGQAFITGWNEIIFDYDSPDSVVGSVPNGFQCTFIDLEFNASASGDTFVNKILIDDIYYGPNDSTEVRDARDYENTLRDRLRTGFTFVPRYMVEGGLVTQDTGTNMQVALAAGACVIGGTGCRWPNRTSGTITAPVTNPRWDTLVANADNSTSLLTGSEAATYPPLPTVGPTQKKLAHIYLTVGMTQITNADIRDARREPAMNEEFMFGLTPVGGIIPWHKSASGVPALFSFDCWQECDGSVIGDPESPLYGVTTPDLNGEGRHLEGAATSGTSLASQNKSHNHSATVTNTSPDGEGVVTVGGNGGQVDIAGAATPTVHKMFDAAMVTVAIGNEGGTDARPKSFTVVMIMRIK